MKLPPRLVRRVVWSSVLALSTGALVYAQFNPQPEPPAHYFGIMTIPAGQRVALHVANTKMAVDAFRPEQSMCTADLRLVNACGETLAQQTVRIQPTEATSLNFTVPPDPGLPPDPDHPPDPGLPPDPCVPLRAQVVFRAPAMHCVSSVEVGDPFATDPTRVRTGGAFIHPAMLVGFNPQPDPPGAPTKAPR